jgi:nucleoside-diphosphate-sugar epimerase
MAVPRDRPMTLRTKCHIKQNVVSNKMSYQTIWVTGAAGFIGFHIVRQLLAEGHKPIGLDNLNSYYDPAPMQARPNIQRGNLRF